MKTKLVIIISVMLVMHLISCDKTEDTVFNSKISGLLTTTSDGNITNAEIKLEYYGSGKEPTDDKLNTYQTSSQATGNYTYSEITSGWYILTIYWEIGSITHSHSPLEIHSGFLVAHYSNGYALALSDQFYFTARKDTIINFNYYNK